MFLILKYMYRALSNVNDRFYDDKRVQHLPLVGQPAPVIAIIILYVLFVKKWGPKWMEDRKPMNLKLIIQVHNIIQILLNAYAFVIGIRNSYLLYPDFSFSCQPPNYNDTSDAMMKLLHVSYIYYLTKYLDLLDTVFFVLRKKTRQASFLHVYHHTIMIVAVWIYMTFLFGAHPTILGIINTFVHTIMYVYYLSSSMDLKIDLLPWKKRITQIQIVQFCYLVIHFALPVFNNWCNLPYLWISMTAVIQNMFMAAMFLDFYYKSYIRKAKTKTNKIN